MSARLLTRSKALALALSRADAAAQPPLASAGWLRTLSSLPRDPAAAPSPWQRVVGSPLGLSKILGYEQTSRLSGTQVLPRWFSTEASGGFSAQQAQISETSLKTTAGIAQSDKLKTQKGALKVTAFSPLEATVAKPRNSPLTRESWKVRRSELSAQVTFYFIPVALLVSKNSLTTSLIVISVFHQIYMFYKEIFLDYVHHEITRKWALIYFKLLLLIMAKDTIVYFNLF